MINITSQFTRVTKLEDIIKGSEIVSIKGKMYCGVKNQEGGYDNEFVNISFVGEGCKKAIKVDLQDKQDIEITSGVLRNKPYLDKAGNPRVFTEIVIFDFKHGDEIEKKPKHEEEKPQGRAQRGGRK